jgi:hypothetical protein
MSYQERETLEEKREQEEERNNLERSWVAGIGIVGGGVALAMLGINALIAEHGWKGFVILPAGVLAFLLGLAIMWASHENLRDLKEKNDE